jgi:UTP--glucose-1-phosphate uridylyltransferase
VAAFAFPTAVVFDKMAGMKPIRKVVIPAAGLGTRGLPFTKEIPKELLPIIDTPALHFIVEEAVQAGIEQVIFVTSKGKSALEDYFDPSPALEAFLRSRGKHELADKIHKVGTMVDVLSVRQKEPRGLGHAILCAKSIVGDEPFAVCLGDEIFPPWGGKPSTGLKRLVEAAQRTGDSVIGIMEVPKSEVHNYGIIDTGGKSVQAGELVSVLRTVEKPKAEDAPSPYAIIGRYVFQPEIMDLLEKVRPGVGGEIQLTDAMDGLASNGKLRAQISQDTRYDVGNHLYYVLAQVDAALQRPELAGRLRPLLKQLMETR